MTTPGADFDLTGTVAIVTGATGWLGPALASALADAGADVLAVARNQDRLDALAATHPRISARSCDITSADWPELVAEVAARHGRLDILVNNAHIGHGDTIATSDPQRFHEAIDLAVTSAVAGLNAARDGFAKAVAAGGSPSVINVGSMYGMVAPDLSVYASAAGSSPPYYGVAKAGLDQLSRYAAAEFGKLGVRVNTLTPGPFPQNPESMDSDFVATLAARTMLNRIGAPDDLRTAVLFLAAPTSAFVTGSNVVVDGGWTSW